MVENLLFIIIPVYDWDFLLLKTYLGVTPQNKGAFFMLSLIQPLFSAGSGFTPLLCI
jgi:hypothetical protein